MTRSSRSWGFGSRSRHDEHPRDVPAGTERRVGGQQREPQLAAGLIRVRDGGDPAIEGEGDPAAVPDAPEVPRERRGEERRVLRQRAQAACCRSRRRRPPRPLLARHAAQPRVARRAFGTCPSRRIDQSHAPLPKCRDLPRERALALREGLGVRRRDLTDLHDRTVLRRLERGTSSRLPRDLDPDGRRRSSGGCPRSRCACRRSAPCFCPGSFMKNGMNARSDRFVRVGSRRRSPPRKLMPWSGPTTTSALSQRPTRLQPADEPAEQPVRVADLQAGAAATPAARDRAFVQSSWVRARRAAALPPRARVRRGSRATGRAASGSAGSRASASSSAPRNAATKRLKSWTRPM